jgi:multidrug resistance efflux pump
VSQRRRIFLIFGVLCAASLGYYYFSTDHTRELVLLGTVDANEVIVSPKIVGRIEQLTVQEGQDVKAGELVAMLDTDELAAAKVAADAQTRSLQFQFGASQDTAASTVGDTANTVDNAQAAYSAAAASLAESVANRRNQEMLTRRTVALAEQGILSDQDRDTAVQTLEASRAHELAAKHTMDAAEATLKGAQARLNQAQAALKSADYANHQYLSAKAQAAGANARLAYCRIVAPISGKVGVWAARQGEVVNPGNPIVTIVDLDQTWVYAALPETQADAVQLGDRLEVRMPSGDRVPGKVIAKLAAGDFATQRDVDRIKRDIKTVQIKLWIPNPNERYVPGMTAEVLVPRRMLAGHRHQEP